MDRKLILLILLTEVTCACNLFAQGRVEEPFGQMAKAASLIPVRPGIPGKVPFWNTYAKRFIYAPAFNYKLIPDAVKYRYKVLCLSNSATDTFESKVPYAPLSPVWGKMPVGFFDLKVTGIAADGDSIGLAGKSRYYHAASFNGPYHSPVLPYDSSAMIALDSLLHKRYISYWLMNDMPDPTYENYQYPAKIFSALITGAVTYAKLRPNTNEAKRAVKIAVTVADYLLEISFPKGSPWAYFPPTYYGKWIATRKLSYIRLDNSMPIYGTKAGNAYLDLYDLIGDKKYLQAAKYIAYTYLKTQLKEGSWYLYVNPKTGKPTSENITIPTAVINYLDRLRKEYKVKGLKEATEKALSWIMANPVRTFNWQGQFEDVGARAPYRNLSREQACDLAIYLFRNDKDNSKYLRLAEELVRFAEDQFVIWQDPRKLIFGKAKGRLSENWITPCVEEQYLYWMPVTRSAGIMIKTYWSAYAATRKKIYLAKAKSIANALTLVQKAHKGNYPTYFTKYPTDHWLNNVVYPAKVMVALEQNIKKVKI